MEQKTRESLELTTEHETVTEASGYDLSVTESGRGRARARAFAVIRTMKQISSGGGGVARVGGCGWMGWVAVLLAVVKIQL